MKGRRVYPDEKGRLNLSEGDYGKGVDGLWECRPPGHHLGSLANHEVVEHEDGTITVSPSILIDYPPEGSWHGYLEKGIWREA